MSATAFNRRRRQLAAMKAKPEPVKPKTPAQMNKADLAAHAAEKGIAVTEGMTKAQILEALAAPSNPNPGQGDQSSPDGNLDGKGNEGGD